MPNASVIGPKLRTDPMEPGPAVTKYRPRRDDYGNVIEPARIWLTHDIAAHPPPSVANVCLQVPADWLHRLEIGDSVQLP